MMFRRHMALYGTTTRQLAEVSVAIRDHACLNPDAVMKKPITIEEHEARVRSSRRCGCSTIA